MLRSPPRPGRLPLPGASCRCRIRGARQPPSPTRVAHCAGAVPAARLAMAAAAAAAAAARTWAGWWACTCGVATSATSAPRSGASRSATPCTWPRPRCLAASGLTTPSRPAAAAQPHPPSAGCACAGVGERGGRRGLPPRLVGAEHLDPAATAAAAAAYVRDAGAPLRRCARGQDAAPGGGVAAAAAVGAGIIDTVALRGILLLLATTATAAVAGATTTTAATTTAATTTTTTATTTATTANC